jgi:hypothetical protein
MCQIIAFRIRSIMNRIGMGAEGVVREEEWDLA